MKNTIRRAVIAEPSETDPIFAAIDRHRATYLAWCPYGIRESHMRHDDPRMTETEAASLKAHNANLEAGRDLARLVPTTMAGVRALLAYVGQFNAGVVMPDDVPEREDWASSPRMWPKIPMQDDPDNGDFDMFAFLILANVRTALAGLTP